jgi:ABC-type amino acid transport substrate-binding protein
MRRFLLQVLVGLAGAAMLSAQAPRPRPVDVETVTILTDGIADPSSPAVRAANALAEQPRALGNIRVLPIAGLGGAANVRDLLHLRGVDLAILNSDILEYLSQKNQYLRARKRIRYVAQLFEQKVYLLVRKELGSLQDLRGRRLAVLTRGGNSHITAVTLFGLTGVDATIEELGSDAILDDASLGKVDGALLLSDELARVHLGAEARKGLRVLPIPLTPQLRRAYQATAIEAQELVGFAEASRVETIAVSTLLAVYNWTPSNGARYATASNFMQQFLAALPALRRQGAGAFWRQVDVNARLPGWTRHPSADPGAALGKAQLAELARVEGTQTMLPPAPPVAAPAPAPRKPKVQAVAVGRAPLADAHLSDGGLISTLVLKSLSAARPDGGAEIELRWATGALPPLRLLLSDATIALSWPWEGADCERPNDLVQASALLCDSALYSDPILQVVVGLFTLSNSRFRFETDESIFGRTVCIAMDQDVSALNGEGRNWLSEKRVTVVRKPTLPDCVSTVQNSEADAFVANDLEGRYVLQRLGLAQQFRMAERPLGTRGIHAIALRENAEASELIQAVNRGLKELKQSDAYGAIVRQHLMRLWDIKPTAQ